MLRYIQVHPQKWLLSTQWTVPIYGGPEEERSRWPGVVQEGCLEEGEFEPGLGRWTEFTGLKEGSRVSHARPGQKSGLTYTYNCVVCALLNSWSHQSRVGHVTSTAWVQPIWPHGSPWKNCWNRCLPGPQEWGRVSAHLPLGV